MGIFRFDHDGQIAGFEEKPDAERLSQIGSSLPPGAMFLRTPEDKPFVASMGIYVFSRQTLLEVLEQDGIDFGKEIIPAALGKYRVQRLPPPRLLGRCGDHRGLLRRQHHADAARCALPLPRSEAAHLHQAAPPASGPRLRRAGRALRDQRRLLAVGRRVPRFGDRRARRRRPARDHHALGARRRRLLRDRRGRGRAGAEAAPGHRQRRRHRPRDHRQERAHRRRVPPGQRAPACRKPTATAGTSEAASSWCPKGQSSGRGPWSRSTTLSGPVGDVP